MISFELNCVTALVEGRVFSWIISLFPNSPSDGITLQHSGDEAIIVASSLGSCHSNPGFVKIF